MTAPVLVVGRSGQIARALVRLDTIAERPIVAIGRPQADLTDPRTLEAVVGSTAPALVVNAGAFTAVDEAESRRSEAFAVNAAGAGALAKICAGRDIPLIHLSSDYVFDGSASRAYREDDPVAPLSAYGASKAAGEAEVRAAGGRHLIVRTSWVYSEDGHNFLLTMLRLAGEREVVAVVNDQQGSPTYAGDVATAIARLAEAVLDRVDPAAWGTYHFTNAGGTTWHGFAAAIFARAKALGFPAPRLDAITTADYPTAARRPARSMLDCGKIERVFGIRPADWRDALDRCLARLAKARGAMA